MPGACPSQGLSLLPSPTLLWANLISPLHFRGVIHPPAPCLGVAGMCHCLMLVRLDLQCSRSPRPSALVRLKSTESPPQYPIRGLLLGWIYHQWEAFCVFTEGFGRNWGLGLSVSPFSATSLLSPGLFCSPLTSPHH